MLISGTCKITLFDAMLILMQENASVYKMENKC